MPPIPRASALKLASTGRDIKFDIGRIEDLERASAEFAEMFG